MKQQKRKGFTLVELLVVIAILAILATVSIVGYTSFVKKANISADQAAVTQINRALLAEEVTNTPTNQRELFKFLDTLNLDLDEYKPLTKDHYFYWVKDINRVIFADSTNKVIYPTDLSGTTYKEGNWYTLSGYIPGNVAVDTIVSGTSATIDSSDKLVSLMDAFASNNSAVNDVSQVTLNGAIDLKGASVSFGTIDTPMTIGGAEGSPATIYGMQSNNFTSKSVAASGELTEYGHGLLGTVKKDTTVENLVIDGAVVYSGNSGNSSQFGLIAGSVNGCTLTIRNVTIKNCYVEGLQKVAALVGQVQSGGQVIIDNVTIENTTVAGIYMSAQVIGYISGGYVDYQNITVNGVTVIQLGVDEYDVKTDADNTTWVKPYNYEGSYFDGTTQKYHWLPSNPSSESVPKN